MRSPVRSARASPSMPATTVGGPSIALAVRERGVNGHGRVERAENRLGDGEPAEDAGLLHEQLGAAACRP